MKRKQEIRSAVAALAALLAASSPALAAEENARLEEVIVTAPPMLDPLIVRTDPKVPRQPVPAQDGGDYLKGIPGFSLARKGGSGGDPVFRGMAGSRLNLLMDGENVLGGCAGRMDPPTAYVFPESYDRITVLKGPQTVRYGGGNVAGTVLFERKTKRFAEPAVRGQASAMFGSFGRNDQVADLAAGAPPGYLRANGTRSDANDYVDGGGTRIHSSFTRWSGSLALGWTPDIDTLAELSINRSDGQAAYADRTVDGVKFERSGFGLRLERNRITPWLEKVEFQAYRNYVDHVMDNFTLRPVQPTNNYTYYLVSNPDRTTEGGRIAFDLAPAPGVKLAAGLDTQRNAHTLRSIVKAVPLASAAAGGIDIASKARMPDMTFDNTGAYAELSVELTSLDRLIGGLRKDWLSVNNEKTSGSGAGASLDEQNRSAFLRYERDLAALPLSLFVGVGRAERPADWWERNRDFYLKPEVNSQLDIGLIWNGERLHAALSLFKSALDDYILVRNNNTARNIDARTQGAELDLAWRLAGFWRANGSLAWVRGDNKTDAVPLAQMPPLEARVGLGYDDKRYALGAMLRLVAAQKRVHPGYGTIVGQDYAETPGFAVFSLNAAYRPEKRVLLTVGIDNLFDRRYAEHINLAGSPVPGFDPVARVYEPGRNLWTKVSFALD
ncbi:MAG: TonB-dependent copper receptor [Betaproteobacteria bacterium]|nr:TonB-dependent copper receptor [Betaproteobacteria bacterium]